MNLRKILGKNNLGRKILKGQAGRTYLQTTCPARTRTWTGQRTLTRNSKNPDYPIKRHEWTFFHQEGDTDDKQAHGKWAAFRDVQTKTAGSEAPLQSHCDRTVTTPNAGAWRLVPPAGLAGVGMEQPRRRRVPVLLTKLNICTQRKTCVHTEACARPFTAALFTVSPNREQPGRPPAGEWLS